MDSFLTKIKKFLRSVFHREDVFTERAYVRSGVSIDYETVEFSGTDKFKHALINAFLMFALVAGTTGAFASAFSIEYNAPMLFALYMIFAFIFSFMNCNKTWQNIGYILFFILFTFCLISFRQFVNSGLNGFLNDFYEYLSDSWGMDVTKTYNEQFEEQHYMTITIFFLTIGLAIMLLINFVFNNEQSPLTVLVLIIPFLAFGLYFDEIPNTLSFVLIATALICCSVFRHNHQFTMPMRDKTVFRHHTKKLHLYIHYSSGRVIAQVAAVILCFMIVFTSIASLLYPSDSYTANSSLSTLKDGTESTVRQILLYGFRSFLESDDSGVGGLDTGSLGNVSTVTNDYATDLTVTFAPYSYETVYLKSWVGTTYTGSSWINELSETYYTEDGTEKECLDAEAQMLAEIMETDSSVLKGKMVIKPEDPYFSLDYLAYPYYTLFDTDNFNTDSEWNRVPNYVGESFEKEVEYYVYQNIWESDYVDQPITTAYDEYVNENYTSVFGVIGTTAMRVTTRDDLEEDTNNVEEQLLALCEEQGFGGTTYEIITQIRDYLEENYTYSLNPGKVPDGEDFVTYFLFENPYGYCSYFATAGTLLLRAMGIPARYVEGYVITMSDVVDATILTDEDYDEWLTGDAEIGQTAVVQAEIDDSKAHAWCEVYLNGYGWVPVEFTTADTEDTEDTNYWNLWSNLTSAAANENTTNALAAFIGTDLGPIFSFLGRIALAALIIAVIIFALRFHREQQAVLEGKRTFYTGTNATVMKQYQRLCSLAQRHGLSDTDNLTPTAFTDLLGKSHISNPDTLSHLRDICQTAAYSPDTISEEVYKEWTLIYKTLHDDISTHK